MSNVRNKIPETTRLTPIDIILDLGPFDLDPCCPDGPMPWKTAETMVAKSANGLYTKWWECKDDFVWCNPPFGTHCVPFVIMMKNHNNGILMLPVRMDTSYWHRYIFGKARAIFVFQGRICFCDQYGRKLPSALPCGVALIAYGERAEKRLNLYRGREGVILKQVI